jgi:hypothetical protein
MNEFDAAHEFFAGGEKKRKARKPWEIAELCAKVLAAVEKNNAEGLEHFVKEDDTTLETGEEVLQAIFTGKKILTRPREVEKKPEPTVAAKAATEPANSSPPPPKPTRLPIRKRTVEASKP